MESEARGPTRAPDLRLHGSKQGFTIVELLIVIVIIGILAAITIVAYNGVQERARAASVSSSLSQIVKKLTVYQLDNNGFPTTLGDINIQNNSNTTYQYTVSNSTAPQTFCVTATTGSTTYKSSMSLPAPTAGGCAGHGVGGIAAITNIVTNPSFESGVNNGYSGYAGAPRALVTTGCYHGLQCTSVDTSAGVNRGIIYHVPVGSTYQSNISYVYSAYVKGPPGQVVVVSARPTDNGDAYLGEGAGGVTYTLTDTWQRISTSAVSLPVTANRPGLQIRANVAGATPFYVDAVMITKGDSLYNYADGSSANWAWSATTNNSTSTGPQL